MKKCIIYFSLLLSLLFVLFDVSYAADRVVISSGYPKDYKVGDDFSIQVYFTYPSTTKATATITGIPVNLSANGKPSGYNFYNCVNGETSFNIANDGTVTFNYTQMNTGSAGRECFVQLTYKNITRASFNMNWTITYPNGGTTQSGKVDGVAIATPVKLGSGSTFDDNGDGILDGYNLTFSKSIDGQGITINDFVVTDGGASGTNVSLASFTGSGTTGKLTFKNTTLSTGNVPYLRFNNTQYSPGVLVDGASPVVIDVTSIPATIFQDELIMVKFSEELLPESVNETNVSVMQGDVTQSIGGVYLYDNNTLEIDAPTDGYDVGDTYSIKITGIQDNSPAKNTLKNTFSKDFSIVIKPDICGNGVLDEDDGEQCDAGDGNESNPELNGNGNNSGCSATCTLDAPVFEFTSDKTTGDSPLNVTFSLADSYPSWVKFNAIEYGDDEELSSPDFSSTVSHTYSINGIHTARLIAVNNYSGDISGDRPTVEETIDISVSDPCGNGTIDGAEQCDAGDFNGKDSGCSLTCTLDEPVFTFTSDKTEGNAPFEVNFSSISNSWVIFDVLKYYKDDETTVDVDESTVDEINNPDFSDPINYTYNKEIGTYTATLIAYNNYEGQIGDSVERPFLEKTIDINILSFCGDGQLGGEEQCDAGADNGNNSGCSATCTLETPTISFTSDSTSGITAFNATLNTTKCSWGRYVNIDLGDSTVIDGPSCTEVVNHTYNEVGTYKAVLTVENAYTGDIKEGIERPVATAEVVFDVKSSISSGVGTSGGGGSSGGGSSGGGGGGGGGGGSSSSSSTENYTDYSSTELVELNSITDENGKVTGIVAVPKNDSGKTELTKEGEKMGIYANTVSGMEISEGTTIDYPSSWDGKLNPPMKYSSTNPAISSNSEFNLGGTKYPYSAIDSIGFVGSETSKLSLSKDAKVTVNLTNFNKDDKYYVYTASELDGEWKLVAGPLSSTDGSISFYTKELGFFAVIKEGNLIQTTDTGTPLNLDDAYTYIKDKLTLEEGKELAYEMYTKLDNDRLDYYSLFDEEIRTDLLNLVNAYVEYFSLYDEYKEGTISIENKKKLANAVYVINEELVKRNTVDYEEKYIDKEVTDKGYEIYKSDLGENYEKAFNSIEDKIFGKIDMLKASGKVSDEEYALAIKSFNEFVLQYNIFIQYNYEDAKDMAIKSIKEVLKIYNK